ncbi:MAG: 50S ribosomal protein L11 methyltransferase [Anaerolineales bacterium]|nr:50S ribosomal protein L11 methyltransferase [Anaerolineales bacterium]
MDEAYWIEVVITAAEEVAEVVAAELQPYAEGESVILEQLGDPQDLRPYAMLPEVQVKLYLAAVDDTAARRQAIADLAAQYNCAAPTFSRLQEQDWANAWKEHYNPFRLGRFWIQPSWLSADDVKPDEIVLTLDPGMAFGTGLHATTQMCLRLLTERLQPKQSVLDVGTGSGILAIAAAKLGAQPVLAIDNDQTAVEAAAANTTGNEVAEMIEVQQGTIADIQRQAWNIVIVNILGAIIMPMLQHQQLLSLSTDNGLFIFSGIVQEQMPQFLSVLDEAGGVVDEIVTQDDWVALVVRRK